MNSRERVLTTFQHKEPDRVPLFEGWIETSFIKVLGGDPFAAREKLGLDCIPVAVGHPASTNAWRDGIDEWGRCWRNGMYGGGLVKTWRDLETYSPSLEYAEAWFPADTMAAVRRRYGEEYTLYYAFHDGPLGLSYESMGMEAFFLGLYDNREFVEAVIGRSTEWTIAMVQQVNAAEVDFMMLGDDAGHKTGVMISPELFRELILPRYKEVLAVANVPVLWHSDGFIEPLLPMIIEAGFAGVHSLEPTAGVDMGRVKEQYCEQLVLAGNLDCTNVLARQDLPRVHMDVERCLKQGAPGGGYLFSSCNSIFDGLQLDSVVEAYHYAREIGEYG